MEHLDELRKRLIHSVVYLLVGFVVAYIFHVRLYDYHPASAASSLGLKLNYHPPDRRAQPLPQDLARRRRHPRLPFILYQVWLFISPGMYANEKKYVVPFMARDRWALSRGSVVRLSLGAAGRASRSSSCDFGKHFHPMITIEDYTGFFLSVILGLGISFELPILIFFLALFGIVDAQVPPPDTSATPSSSSSSSRRSSARCPIPFSMCLFASPMLALYLVGVGVACLVHPDRRKAKEAQKPA